MTIDPRSQIIRDALHAQGRTQEWLSRQTEYSRWMVSKYLRGERRMPDAFIERAGRELGLPQSVLSSRAQNVPDGDTIEPNGPDHVSAA